MEITYTTLPMKDGYIEVEIDGVRQYQRVITEEVLFQDDLAQMTVDLQYRLTLIELGV